MSRTWRKQVNRMALAAYVALLWAATPAWVYFGFVGAFAVVYSPPEHAGAALRMVTNDSILLVLKLYLPALALAWLMLWQIDRSVK